MYSNIPNMSQKTFSRSHANFKDRDKCVYYYGNTYFYNRIFRVKLNRIARDSTQKYSI